MIKTCENNKCKKEFITDCSKRKFCSKRCAVISYHFKNKELVRRRNKEIANRKDVKDKKKNKMILLYNDPVIRKKRSQISTRVHARSEVKRKVIRINIKNGQDLGIRKKIRLGNLKTWNNRKKREHSDIMKEVRNRPEVIEKYQKIYTQEKRRQFSLLFQGSNNPAWNGGSSFEPYSPEFTKDLKNFILQRDDYQCQNPDCWHAADYLSLCIHHIDYNKKNCYPNNLIALCISCNTRANKNRNHWKVFYMEIVNEKKIAFA